MEFEQGSLDELLGTGIAVQHRAGAAPATPTELAARRTLDELHAAGVLRPVHALHVQLVLDLARAVGLGVSTGKASAVAMASKELTSAMALLPPLPEDAGDEDVPAGGPVWAGFLAAVEAAPGAEAAALAAESPAGASWGDSL